MGELELNDAQIQKMVSYVVKYLNTNCPENLEVMVHLIGHDEEYRKRVEKITEETLDSHDNLFVSCGNGKNLEDITPQFAEQCQKARKEMMQLVQEYISCHS